MDRIRVTQFGTYWASPLVARCLAGFGCDVVTIERPPTQSEKARHERLRLGAAFDELRHGTRRVVATLPNDLDAVRELLQSSDIVIEGFAPGVATRLGVGFDDCRRLHPNVLYASLPGFAEQDSDQAFEAVILAAAGVFRDMGLNRSLLSVEASFTHLPLASVYGAVYSAFGILTAWYAEHRGQRLVFPLAASLAETMVHNSIDLARDPCYMCPRERAHRAGERHVSWDRLRDLTCPFFRTYECVDGRWIYLVCPAHKTHQRRAVAVLGIEQEVETVLREVDPYHHQSSEAGFGCGSLSDAQTLVVGPLFEAAFRTRTAEEWDAELGRVRVPVMIVRTHEEWLSHPHVRDSGLIDEDGHLANLAWVSSYRPLRTPSLPSVASDGHMAAERPPLHGVRVLDTTNVIAGPTISQCLARMGAEVIQIDPCVPTYAPEVTVFYGLSCNRGKESVLLDTSCFDGQACLRALVETSDVLVVNATCESLRRLGVTERRVREWNPRLIFARFDAWGGPTDAAGELAGRIGYDDCVQAGTGIMDRFGGGRPEEHAHIGTIDHIAGVGGAVGIMAALIERKWNRRVGSVRSSLVAMGHLLQFPFVCRVPRSSLGRGVGCVGEDESYRAIRLDDGTWAFVVTWNATRSVCAEDRRSWSSLRRWSEDAGGTATPLKRLSEVRDDHRVIAPMVGDAAPSFQFVYDPLHPIGSVTLVAFHALRGLHGQRTTLAPAPKYGSHTRKILQTLVSDDEYLDLLRRGIVSESWSTRYIPVPVRCTECRDTTTTRRYVIEDVGAVCAACCVQNAVFRSGYRRWRLGQSRGSVDGPPPSRDCGLRRAASASVLSCQRQRTS